MAHAAKHVPVGGLLVAYGEGPIDNGRLSGAAGYFKSPILHATVLDTLRTVLLHATAKPPLDAILIVPLWPEGLSVKALNHSCHLGLVTCDQAGAHVHRDS